MQNRITMEEHPMLSKPIHGWTDFQLEGTGEWGLSYLTDIPFKWLDQAIHGLETSSPFCVEAYLEPGRFLCLVSFWNCYVLCENEEPQPSEEDNIQADVSPINMLQFCKNLHKDISENIGDWVAFYEFSGQGPEERKAALDCKLARLQELISEHEDGFSNSQVTFTLGDEENPLKVSIGDFLW